MDEYRFFIENIFKDSKVKIVDFFQGFRKYIFLRVKFQEPPA